MNLAKPTIPIVSRLHHFPEGVFGSLAELLDENLAVEKDTLLVACSEMGAAPDHISFASRDRVFILQNLAASIPSRSECEEYEGLSFEAIEALFDKYEFRHVIICVHAGCRAIPYWLKPDREIESDIGGFRRRFESGARNLVDLNYFPNSDLERVRLMVCEHILCQVENCLTHPVVKSRVESKRTDFHAWLACDETARVYAYDPNESAFKKI